MGREREKKEREKEGGRLRRGVTTREGVKDGGGGGGDAYGALTMPG